MSDKMIEFNGVMISEESIIAKGYAKPAPRDVEVWEGGSWLDSVIGAKRYDDGWRVVVDTTHYKPYKLPRGINTIAVPTYHKDRTAAGLAYVLRKLADEVEEAGDA